MRLSAVAMCIASTLLAGCANNVKSTHQPPMLVSTLPQSALTASAPDELSMKVQAAVEVSTQRDAQKNLTGVQLKPTSQPAFDKVIPLFANTAPKAPVRHELVARTRDTWEQTLSRWLRERGYKTVAFYYPAGVPETFSSKPTKTDFVAPDFYHAMHAAQQAFLAQNNTSYAISYDENHKSAVIHHPAQQVQTFMVNSGSLKANAIQLAGAYGWKSNEAKWMTKDFYISAGWPIITEKGNVTAALDELVGQFPIQPQLLKATHEVFFVKGQG